MLFARVRSFLARHRAVYWAGVAAVALVVTWSVLDRVHRLDDARRAWGEARTAWVASGDLATGDAVVAVARPVPLAVVPPSALIDDPAGLVVVRSVGAGEVLTEADVGRGEASLIPAGWRAVAIPRGEAALALAPGDRVDVVADAVVLCADAAVIAAGPEAITIAVPADQAAAVAFAAQQRTASLALRGPATAG